MARQPLIPWLVLAGCGQVEPYVGAFDVPVAAAVLQPEIGGPFSEPIGFVANGHGGQIVQVALKQGRFLTDDPTVSFLRTNQLATGGDRSLSSVAVYAPSVREVTVFAGDRRYGNLIRIPYLVDCDQYAPDTYAPCDRGDSGPVESRAYVERDTLVAPDGVVVSDLSVKTGWTTTELWELTYDGTSWSVTGSRSGHQRIAVDWDVPWSADDRRLNLTLSGAAEIGDTITIKTRNGLSEHDVGGIPMALALSPDQTRLAAIVHDRVDDRPRLWWIDPVDVSIVSEVNLPPGAWPHRLAWAEDGTLLVADSERPAAYEVQLDATEPIEQVLPWPTLDVAAMDTEDGSRLYVVPIDGQAVWLVDRGTGSFIDINGSQAGDQGMRFTTPVRGIEAMFRPYLMPEFTQDGVKRTGRSVAISLGSGSVVFAHEQTGCLVQDNLGPRTTLLGTASSDDFTASLAGAIAPALFELNGASDRHIIVNTCAGIAKEELWELRYDQQVGAWRASGSLSGDQDRLVYEDERYINDDGAISFTLRSGALPSRDGWRMTFAVDEGTAEATGDIDGDGIRDNDLSVAGDPVYFFYRVGLAGAVGDSNDEGWYPVDVRPQVLVLGAASNEVGRVDPLDALIEVGWQ